MTWTLQTSNGFESRKCRDRCLPYLQGKAVFDLGCGNEKVLPWAFGIDLQSQVANMQMDLSNPESLSFFSEKIVDAVFSSHLLEHIEDTEAILKSWWRLVKAGGYLVLYLPCKGLYPNDGNPDHKHEFEPKDIIDILNRFASYKLIKSEVHGEDNEYSFEIVAQKIESPVRVIMEAEKEMETPDTKKALVIRYGAVGDMIVITPVLRLLKKDGYHVSVVCAENTSVLDNNPNVDKLYPQKRDSIPSTQLMEYHKVITKGYDKVVNLCESVERTLLRDEMDDKLFFSPKEQRQADCNVNYYDRTLELAGYGHIKGLNGELFISEAEASLIKVWNKRNEGFFKVMVQVRGSSEHKIYPYITDIVDELVEKHSDIRFFLTGGIETQVLDWVHPNIRNCIGKWNTRQSIIMTNAVDLVLSPETGILNAAGCFDTPKIGLLTHSSKENLTKYFKNDYSIESNVECAPCHKLVHKARQCKNDIEFGLPICMSRGLSPELVMEKIMLVYEKWKQKRIV